MSEPQEAAKPTTQFSTEGVTQDELWKPPAFFCNRFFVTGMGANVRLVFAEQEVPEGTTHVRTACVMTTADAIQLRDLLSHVLKDVQIVNTAVADPNG